MKIYAQFFTYNDIEYRLNTILQFGDSWELIGNIVLANPGSAKPLHGSLHPEEVNHIEQFIQNYRTDHVAIKNWYEFRPDATMLRIERIFNGWYINPEATIELNGVIQLFNTFNTKNQDLEDAILTLPEDNPLLYSIGIERQFHGKPTYFGFSGIVINHEKLRKIAENIFNNTDELIKVHYNTDFAKNSFYHPTFVNRAYKRDFFQPYKDKILRNIVTE